ncbi:hypothetical protein FOZ60_007590 [Perkinsus olseni]|uniref:3'-5' exonuclease domain-containing protein n=1 Tax=Perkinsus olseni TaxID=32597 RepID=A0A7J6PEI7_PEROL|nr:hypothetical protein FOZ60_007590 [Perkinsus olseni]
MCSGGIPPYMCDLDTVDFYWTNVINEIAGHAEPRDIARLLQGQNIVGLGIQCNAGEQGIHAISVATLYDGVFVYILAKKWLPEGLWRLLRNDACTKVICNINDAILGRLERYRLPNVCLFDIGDRSVQSAAETLNLRVFKPHYRDFYDFSTPDLDAGHEGYLATNALVPLVVAAHRQQAGLHMRDYHRMTRYFKRYDVNEASRSAVVASQRAREQSEDRNANTPAKPFWLCSPSKVQSSKDEAEASPSRVDEGPLDAKADTAHGSEDEELSSSEDEESSGGEIEESLGSKVEGSSSDEDEESSSDEDEEPSSNEVEESSSDEDEESPGTGADRPSRNENKAALNDACKRRKTCKA